jgi:hypothetical protein
MTQATRVKRDSGRRDALVRIDSHTDSVLSDLARERHEDKKKVLARSVEFLRRQTMLDGLCEAYRELRNSPEAWAEEQAERAEWQSAALTDLRNE